jgi:hypothetical protein
MENLTLAEVTPGDTVPAGMVSTNTVVTNAVAEVIATQAAMRPLAGSGAGAFACDGAWAGSPASKLAAGPALPRIRGAFAAVQLVQMRTAGAFGSGYQGRTVGIGGSTVSTTNGSAKQLNPTTHVRPIIQGGLGSHPAREPDPV